MEPILEPVPVAAPKPGEKLQSQLCLDIKLTKDLNTGEVKTDIINFDITNYDGLIKDIPLFLGELNVRYAINLIQEYLRSSAR